MLRKCIAVLLFIFSAPTQGLGTTIKRYALDQDPSVSGTLVSSRRDIYDISWVSGDFLGFGYFKGKAVHFMVSFDMTDLANDPIDAYIELCQIRQIGTHPWNSNPWCDRGPTVINPDTGEPYGYCLRVIAKNQFGSNIDLEVDDMYNSESLSNDLLIAPVRAIRRSKGKVRRTGMKYQLPLDVKKLDFDSDILQFLITMNGPNRRPNGRWLSNTTDYHSRALSEDEDEDGSGCSKVIICHYPPGNPTNPITIQICQQAWPTHRDQHGDKMGACAGGSGSGGGISSDTGGSGGSGSSGGISSDTGGSGGSGSSGGISSDTGGSGGSGSSGGISSDTGGSGGSGSGGGTSNDSGNDDSNRPHPGRLAIGRNQLRLALVNGECTAKLVLIYE